MSLVKQFLYAMFLSSVTLISVHAADAPLILRFFSVNQNLLFLNNADSFITAIRHPDKTISITQHFVGRGEATSLSIAELKEKIARAQATDLLKAAAKQRIERWEEEARHSEMPINKNS